MGAITVALSELQALVDHLAQRLDAPTVLEDHRQRMVVYSSHSSPIDDVRRESILRRDISPEVKDWFQRFGIFRADAPLHIPSHPELGILGRLCAPARFRGRLMGYLFLIDDDQRLAGPDMDVVNQAGKHAGALLYEEELGQRLSASILSNLLGPSADLRESAAQQLIEQGMPAEDVPHAVVYVRPVDLAINELSEMIGEMLWELGCRRGHAGLLRVAREDHGVLMARLAADDDDRAVRVAAEAREMLASRLSRKPGSARVVVGVGDAQRYLTSAVVSYRQALLAARVSAAVPSVGDVAPWRTLGVFRALVQIPPGERCDSSLDPRLDKLLAGDGDLARTVETYLDLGGDAGRTAKRLNVHRATLYYRLNKAEQLTGANLHDGNDRLALHLGFKLARLMARYPA